MPLQCMRKRCGSVKGQAVGATSRGQQVELESKASCLEPTCMDLQDPSGRTEAGSRNKSGRFWHQELDLTRGDQSDR